MRGIPAWMYHPWAVEDDTSADLGVCVCVCGHIHMQENSSPISLGAFVTWESITKADKNLPLSVAVQKIPITRRGI